MNHSFKNSQSLSLNYLEKHKYLKNKQNSTPLLLLHEIGDSSDSWEKVSEDLKDKFLVIQIDFRGHGLNLCFEKVGIDESVSDILDYLDQSSYKSFYLMGHGFGGECAVIIANQRPNLIKKLILIETEFSDSIAWEEWGKISIPSLYVRGRQSDVISHELAIQIREKQKMCFVTELEGGGHQFHEDSPHSLISAIFWFESQ